MTSISVRLQEVDALLRAGRRGEARQALRSLVEQGLPRETLVTAAQLSRRAGDAEQGLRSLTRHVRLSARLLEAATPAEIAEYAACLAHVGAHDEALQRLRDIDEKQVPIADLYRALCHAGRWCYRESIAPLERYLSSSDLDVYHRLVAQVNLAAALVFEREDSRATKLLRALLPETLARGYPVLHGYALELTAEHCILRGRWHEAERCLDRARRLFVGEASVYGFLVEKWTAILQYMRGKGGPLEAFRRRAIDRAAWETVRECDRFIVLKTRDPELTSRLYHGTPHPAYRERLRRELGDRETIPAAHERRFGAAEGPAMTLDLVTGALFGSKGGRLTKLRVGQLRHRLLLELSGDFYAPVTVASLHTRLNPGYRYLHGSSGSRIHEGVRITRRWLERHGVPLAIVSRNGEYRLEALGSPVIVRIGVDTVLKRLHGDALDSIRRHWTAELFSAEEAARYLAQPVRTVRRLLGRAVCDGIVDRLGKGRSTRHRFRPTVS